MRLFQLTLGILVVMAAACGGEAPSTPATSEAPAAASAPAGQGAILSDLVKDWQEQKDGLMKLADAMPEDKFGYKSTPPQRSYGEHIMHAALVNVDLLKLLGGKAAAPTFTADSVKTKADIVAALAASYRLRDGAPQRADRGDDCSDAGCLVAWHIDTRPDVLDAPVPLDGRVWADGRLLALEWHRASGEPRGIVQG